MKNTEGSGVAKGASSPRRDIIICTLLRWSHHVIAHVWTLVVVKVDNVPDYPVGVIQVLRPFHPVLPFLFYYTIHTFGNGIVCRLVVLCH